MYSTSYTVATATVIYLCIRCLCQGLSNTNRNLLLQSELWHFHTYNKLDKEAVLLHCEVDLKLDGKVYLHGL